MTGTVKLTVTVSAEGTVKALKARGGNPVLIEAAEEAVKRWKYEPAKTESSESVTINFQAPE
jgi:TonB family protein